MSRPGVVGARSVDIIPLRQAFLRSGRTAGSIAIELEWFRRGHPDSNRVTRSLGISPYHQSRGRRPRCVERTSYERAVMLAQAIGVDPVEVGL